MSISRKYVKECLYHDIHQRIKNFFVTNPNPSDEEIHNLASDMDMEPSELEQHIYMVLSNMLKRKMNNDIGNI